MSTGIFSVDGIDVAGLVAEHLGPRVLPATLWKQGETPERDPDDPTAVPEPPSPVPLSCRGFVDDFKPTDIDGNLIKAGDRKIILLGGTIPSGAVPEDNDQVTIEGIRYHIPTVISRDPAAATYTLVGRDL